jgi:probable HAF family extracellular repeat protein
MRFIRSISVTFRGMIGLAAVLAILVLPAAAATTSYKVQQINPTGSTKTYAIALNKSNTVVGNYTDASGVVHGFKFAMNKYTAINFPKANKFTRANGINDGNLIVGDFFGTDNFYHGFTFSSGKYTQYDIALGTASTSIFGVNNAGDTVGATGSGGPNQGFINIGGTVTEFYGSGTDNTFALAINNNNEVVGQFYDSTGNSHCFDRSSTGTITEIVYPSAVQTACTGINDSGLITGWYENSLNQFYAFEDNAGTFTSLDFISASGVNNSGSFVGYYLGPGASGGEPYGYIASPHTMKSMSTVKVMRAQSTSIIGVNNTNVMVGQYTNSSGQTHGLMLSGTTATNIDDPKAQTGTTFCNGINSSGTIVGYYTTSTNATQGFMYSSGTFTDIGPAGAQFSEAVNINDSSVINGVYEDSSNVFHAFTYNGSTYTTIDVPGASVTEGWGINATGELTLDWVDSNGYWESSEYNGTTFTTVNVPGATQSLIHSINKSGNVVYTWYDFYGVDHGALLVSGSYYIFDDASGTSTRADGINDSNLIVGRFLQTGSTTLYDGYKATN